MKICMFTNTYLPHVGGVARSVDTFSRDLEALGHEVLIVAPIYKSDDGEPEPEEGVVRLPAIQNFNGSDFSLRFPTPFIIDEHLDRFVPDIIHSHHPYLLGDAALRAARQRSIPLVFTHHTLYENYTHYVPLDSKAMRRFVVQLSTEYANLCDKIIAPSRSVADLMHERGVIRPIEEIPTGVDVDFFAKGRNKPMRHKLGLSDEEIVIGHLGRLAPEKNLAYLSEAVAEYLKTSEWARFLLVGKGPSESEVEDIFLKMGLENRLILAGKMTGTDLADAYAAMDLFVFASHSETQGMVLTEAMASGKPVIALDASGAREVVRDGRNGRLLEADASVDTFASAISELINDDNLMDSLRHGAIKTAREFSRETCSQKLEQLYDQAISEQNPEALNGEETHMALTSVVERIKAEWDLIAGKTNAVVEAIAAEDEGAGLV